ncbi:MAG TPA: bifunctional UDP-N-acetylglucosamine diphosphorylase/glucosamine-1-phosphate N-acetyltransferase GlmU [Firmicutes bacterium]|nr:bifunctional UDP-N-acetylglucosamine diphosphorylase/glucosamine-1-phosphate N-acetyltransferase GlmU [Bacillota bacterium]
MTTAVILAAGEGKRMQSRRPKVLHEICGYPMLAHVIHAARSVCSDVIVVVGHQGEEIRAAFGDSVVYAEQHEQLGTAHALLQAEPLLPDAGTVLVLCGDTPLLSPGAIEELYAVHSREAAAATVLTATVPNPFGYGRIVRGAGGEIIKIVEEKDATAAEKLLREINTGTYAFDVKALREGLAGVGSDNAAGEYYLTDCIELIIKSGKKVATSLLPDYRLALGVNDRIQLAEAQALLQERINRDLMAAGVTMINPATIYVDAGVKVGRDTVILPNTALRGRTVVGEGCVIGPQTEITDSTIGSGSHIRHSVVTESILEENVTVGPFTHLRPGTVLKNGVKVGDFVEIKQSQVGEGSKIPHLSYIGDAEIGSGVNLGGGTIVVNYDGRKKYKTVVADGAFVGCNSNLVAPVTIGRGAFVAAGSTITNDVPAGALSLARARQVDKPGLGARLLGHKDDEN